MEKAAVMDGNRDGVWVDLAVCMVGDAVEEVGMVGELAGGEIKIGVLKSSVATSMSSATPDGIALDEKFMLVSSTNDNEVQSKKLSVVCNSSAGLNSTKICSSICSF